MPSLVDLSLRATDDALPVTAAGDLALLSGAANAAAALERRLVTRPGALVHRPAYGARLIGALEARSHPARHADVAQSARRACLADPRVADARARVRADGALLEVNLSVRLHESPVEHTVLVRLPESA
jgi:phage baseplate assembly protein W